MINVIDERRRELRPDKQNGLRRPRVLVLLLNTFVIGTAFADSEKTQTEAMGTWVTAGYGSTVRLEPCEPDQARIELCGTITWLWEAKDDNGEARVDGKNPDRSARTRPLIGTRILSGFRRDRNGIWRGGKVYNPDDGRTYSGTIRIAAPGVLELKGCALKVFCQTQTWRRAGEVCAAAPG